jgi:hypothetical protein
MIKVGKAAGDMKKDMQDLGGMPSEQDTISRGYSLSDAKAGTISTLLQTDDDADEDAHLTDDARLMKQLMELHEGNRV